MSWENKHIQPFTFYCQKILPLVYDESLSYYETLCKIQKVLNEVIGNQNNLNNVFTELLNYVNTQLETYAKEQLEEWLDDGTLANVINESIFNELNKKINYLLDNKIFHMKDYIIPDGNTDNTELMQKAINEAEGNILIIDGNVFPYRCNQLLLKNNSTYIFEKNTTIKANDTWINSDRWQDPLLDIRQVNGVKIIGNGGTITMNKPAELQTEHAHCLGTRGATNVYIENLNLTNASGDGFYIDQYDGDESNTPSSNIHLKGLICNNNGRQGLSIVSGYNLIIENCIFSNTKGKAPQSGLDIEAELRSTNMSNIVIRNCSFLSNQYAGLLVACGNTAIKTELNVFIDNCYFYGAGYGIFVNGIKENQKGAIKVNNCYMENTGRCAILDAYNVNNGIIRTYSNCSSVNANQSDTDQNNDTTGEWGWATAFLIHSEYNKANGNCNFIGCQAISTDGKCKTAFGFTATDEGSIDGISILSCSQSGINQSFNGSHPRLRNANVRDLPKPINTQPSRIVDSSNYYQEFVNGTLTLGTNLNKYAIIEFTNTGGNITTLNKQSGINIFPYNKASVSLSSIGSRIVLRTENGADYFVLEEVKTTLLD